VSIRDVSVMPNLEKNSKTQQESSLSSFSFRKRYAINFYSAAEASVMIVIAGLGLAVEQDNVSS